MTGVIHVEVIPSVESVTAINTLTSVNLLNVIPTLPAELVRSVPGQSVLYQTVSALGQPHSSGSKSGLSWARSSSNQGYVRDSLDIVELTGVSGYVPPRLLEQWDILDRLIVNGDRIYSEHDWVRGVGARPRARAATG